MSMGDATTSGCVVDVYPLSCYAFGSKEPNPEKDAFLVDRIERMKSNYTRDGLRICVEGVLLVELFEHPHLLLLQVKNSFFKLPGGRLRPGETDTDGLKRKLSSKLSANDANGTNTNWEIGECIGMWWRTNFETLMLPYCPAHVKKPKECTKLFLVKLQGGQQFHAPKNMRMLAVPLCELHDNEKFFVLMDLRCSWIQVACGLKCACMDSEDFGLLVEIIVEGTRGFLERRL